MVVLTSLCPMSSWIVRCLSDSGSIVIRSLPPLPSRTVISLRAKSISWIRRRRHSIRRRPAPYMSETDLCGTSRGAKEMIEMLRKSLLLVNTFYFGCASLCVHIFQPAKQQQHKRVLLCSACRLICLFQFQGHTVLVNLSRSAPKDQNNATTLKPYQE